jgi:signal transduction histidine kinase
MKLRTKFAVIMLVGTLVLGSAVYGGLELYKQQTLEQSQHSVNESATLAAGQIQSSIDERADYVGYVASRPDVATFEENDRVVDGVVENSRFFAAQVVDANGTVVAFGGQITDSVRDETIGSNVGDEAYFRGAMQRSSYVSDPEYVPSRDQHLVVVSAPIIDDRGVVGVLAASVYVSTDTFLNPVTALDTQSQRVTVTAGESVLYESADQFSQATVGEAVVGDYGWRVTVEQDRAPLNAQLRTLALAQGFGLLVVLAFVVGVWTWELRTNLNQTERLLSGFSSLRDGEHDHRVELTSGEEWEQISEGFNELADGLATREAAIREREQRLSVLNRVLRHNLRNDMNVIVGYAQLIDEQVTDDTLSRASETILSKGQHLVDLSEKARWVDTSLDDQLSRQPLDAVTLAEDAVDTVSEEHPAADIRLSTPRGATLLAVPGVRAALVNVVENACVHDDSSEPTVKVTVTVDDDTVRVAVADTGPGIPAHEREVLRADSETALDHGSGLGMWVVNWLVQQSDGELTFDENSPRGSIVTLAFEAVGAESERTAAAADGGSETAGR